MKPKLIAAFVVGATLIPAAALAEEKHEYGPKPFHYSLPFQLRPAITWNVVRSDTSYSFYEGKNSVTGEKLKGNALVTSMLVGYKVTEAIQPFVRIAYTYSAPPAGGTTGVVSNPLLGVTYGLKPTEEIRVAAVLGVTAPIGQGGGDKPDLAKASAQQAGNLTRSAMDGVLFAVNDLAIIPGVSAAWIAKGLTIQGELTYVQLLRMRGASDSAKAVLTSGLHVGYFVVPQLSFGGELRHMRFLTTPVAVNNIPAARDNTTFAIGARGHFEIGKFWLRPGVSVTMPLDKPFSDTKLKVIQLDIPFVF